MVLELAVIAEAARSRVEATRHVQLLCVAEHVIEQKDTPRTRESGTRAVVPIHRDRSEGKNSPINDRRAVSRLQQLKAVQAGLSVGEGRRPLQRDLRRSKHSNGDGNQRR